VTQLRQALENSGVNVHAGAPYKLILVNETENQRAASYSGGVSSSEYQVASVLNYEIVGHDNRSLLSDKLEVQKYFMHDGNNLAGSDQGAAQATREIRREMVQRMILRLQQLTPAELDQLQQTADARAKAEADALEAARRTQAEQPQQSPLQLPIK
jgi:LPS-assembly lipoprotein